MAKAVNVFVAGMIVGAVLAIGLLLTICAFAPITTTYVNPYVGLSVFSVSLVLLATAVVALKPENRQSIETDT